MIKIISNIYYWFALGCPTYMYDYDKKADMWLKKFLKNKIVLIKKSPTEINRFIIYFDNNSLFKFWDSGKTASWLSDGDFHELTGKVYYYVNKKVSLKMFLKLKRRIKEYKENNNIE